MKFRIACIPLLFFFGCKPNSENKIAMNIQTKANQEIKFLIEQHDYNVSENNKLLYPAFKEKVVIDSRLTTNEFTNGVNSQLDIVVEFQNGRKIVESFGDIGTTKKEVIENNLKNFVANDFHVMINALNNTVDDNITFEEWGINNQKYEAYIGNFGSKGNFKIPDDVFITIEEIIKKQEFKEEYHWVRFFYANLNHEPAEIEFMIDNERNNEAEKKMENLNWDKNEAYYSLRNFIIFKKK